MKYDEDEFADLRASLRIDDCNLEVECAKQSGLYHYWGERLAEAKSARDKLKDQLKLEEAKRALEIRNDPNQGKITEALVASLVAGDENLYTIRSAINASNKLVYSLEAAVEALEHKRSQLSNLVQLFIKNHYQDVRDSQEKSVSYSKKINQRTQGE